MKCASASSCLAPGVWAAAAGAADPEAGIPGGLAAEGVSAAAEMGLVRVVDQQGVAAHSSGARESSFAGSGCRAGGGGGGTYPSRCSLWRTRFILPPLYLGSFHEADHLPAF